MIYKYKTKRTSPKDFKNYQNLRDLFKDLRDGNLNPKEVLKYQFNFNSDLGEIRKGNSDLKSKDQVRVDHVENVSDLRVKSIDFFRDCYFLISEAKYKTKHTNFQTNVSKIINSSCTSKAM